METGAQGGGEATETTQEQTQQDTGGSRLLDSFESFRTDITSRLDELDQRFQAQEESGDYEDYEDDGPDPDSPQFDANDFDDEGQLTPEATQRALDQVIERKFAEMAGPLVEDQQRLQAERVQERNDAYADYLEATYPDFRDADTAAEMVEKAREQAYYLASRTGQDQAWADQLAKDAEFLEQVYLADKARGTGAEGAAGQQEVQLESGGAAGPPQTGWDEDAAGDAIVNAGGRKFRLGS